MVARNKEQLIHIAARLFLHKGFRYTSIEDIVQASGVSRSNLYFHFKSKEELLLASVEFWANRYESALEISLVHTEVPVKERLAAFIELLISEITARDGKGYCPFIALYQQSPNEAEEVLSRIKLFFHNLHMLVAKLIEQGQANGEFREDIAAKNCAYLFVSSLEGSLVLAETTQDITVVRTTFEHFIQLMK